MAPHDHPHGHDHHHDHDHGHAQPHRHPNQPDVEDKPYTHYMVLAQAVGELLIDKKRFSADELRRMIEIIDAKSPAAGAQMVARAWVDPAFKARMLKDVNATAAELGIDAGTIIIRAIENEPKVHNVVVCTLCSCYPRLLIGLPPDWYKSRAYRSRMVRDPRTVLAEFGTRLPADVEVRVHDSTADLRFLILPMRPKGTENKTEAELAELVTRDAMVGVTAIDR